MSLCLLGTKKTVILLIKWDEQINIFQVVLHTLMFDTSTKNRSTDHFYEAFIDINYTLCTFCWTRTILGSSNKMFHAFHQEISAIFACDMRFCPYTKCEARRFATNLQKAFLRDFEAIMKIHLPLQLENKMKFKKPLDILSPQIERKRSKEYL